MTTPSDPNSPYSQPLPQDPSARPGPPPGQGFQPGPPPPAAYHQYGQAPPPLTAAQARANAKGAKAQAKAMRPWFQKKRTWLAAVLALIVIGSIANGGSDDPPTAAPVVADANAVAEPTAKLPATKTTAPAAAKVPEKTKAPEATKTTAPAPPVLPGIGDTVSAGDWAFSVTSLKCGVKKVGDDFLGKKAQGQFCLLRMKVTNNGDTAETLMGSNQKLLDDKGRTFSSDDEASIYADSDASLFSEEINPGNTLKGVVVFDIPKGASPVEADLAGGFFGIKDVAKIDVSE
jgi:hypothetical protein